MDFKKIADTIFKRPIIERPHLPISEKQDALGMRLYIWQYICSNETFVGVDSTCLSFQLFGDQQNPSRAS